MLEICFVLALPYFRRVNEREHLGPMAVCVLPVGADQVLAVGIILNGKPKIALSNGKKSPRNDTSRA